MTCERVRWLLSLDPTGRAVAQNPLAHRHLDHCPSCREFARALVTVEEALAARPFAQPRPGLAVAVLGAAHRWPRQGALEPPFSRPFWALCAALTLCALVGGALLLQHWSSAWPPDSSLVATQVWLNPSWPNTASAWLSAEAERAAQTILALVAGLIVSAMAAALGFKAHEREAQRPTRGARRP